MRKSLTRRLAIASLRSVPTGELKVALLCAFLLPALAACGFSPLYATDAEGIRSEMRGVVVGSVTGPPDAAYFAEDALRDVLPGRGTAEYALEVQLREQRRAVAVTAAANTTRFDYVLNARYSLRNLATGEVRQNTIQSVVSYGVVESQYASLVGREDAVRRASLDMARRVETDIALYLKGRAPEASKVPLDPMLTDREEERIDDFDDDVLNGKQAPSAPATDAPTPLPTPLPMPEPTTVPTQPGG